MFIKLAQVPNNLVETWKAQLQKELEDDRGMTNEEFAVWIKENDLYDAMSWRSIHKSTSISVNLNNICCIEPCPGRVSCGRFECMLPPEVETRLTKIVMSNGKSIVVNHFYDDVYNMLCKISK